MNEEIGEQPGATDDGSAESPFTSPTVETRFDTPAPFDDVEFIEPYEVPGPGLPEALLWILLMFVTQTGAIVILIGAAAMFSSVGIQEVSRMGADNWLATLSATARMFIMTSPAFFSFAVMIPLGLWRMSPRPLQKLNFSAPTVSQMVVAASLVLPLTMFANSIMMNLEPIWLQFSENIPGLNAFNDMDVHKLLMQYNTASLAVALFLIAVTPGIGEEFVFRGLLGRGILARWGLVPGVLITSFLFAAVHMYPPHVLAILPVGIALHWIYLTTKSFWAPVIFHFLNNAISVILMRAPQSDEQGHWSLTMIAVVYTAWCLYWLFQMRTLYESEDGPVYSPGFEVAAPTYTKTWRKSKTFIVPVIVATVMLLAEITLIVSAFFPS